MVLGRGGKLWNLDSHSIGLMREERWRGMAGEDEREAKKSLEQWEKKRQKKEPIGSFSHDQNNSTTRNFAASFLDLYYTRNRL